VDRQGKCYRMFSFRMNFYGKWSAPWRIRDHVSLTSTCITCRERGDQKIQCKWSLFNASHVGNVAIKSSNVNGHRVPYHMSGTWQSKALDNVNGHYLQGCTIWPYVIIGPYEQLHSGSGRFETLSVSEVRLRFIFFI
jgi:hypothetical protein